MAACRMFKQKLFSSNTCSYVLHATQEGAFNFRRPNSTLVERPTTYRKNPSTPHCIFASQYKKKPSDRPQFSFFTIVAFEMRLKGYIIVRNS